MVGHLSPHPAGVLAGIVQSPHPRGGQHRGQAEECLGWSCGGSGQTKEIVANLKK